MSARDNAVPTVASGAASDVWALALVLLNLLSARAPWPRALRVHPSYFAFSRDPLFLLELLPISNALNDLLRRMLRSSPLTRLSAAEAHAEFAAIPSGGLFRDGAADAWTPALAEEWARRAPDAGMISDLRLSGKSPQAGEKAESGDGSGVPAVPARSLCLMRCTPPDLCDSQSAKSSVMVPTPPNRSSDSSGSAHNAEKGKRSMFKIHRSDKDIPKMKSLVTRLMDMCHLSD